LKILTPHPGEFSRLAGQSTAYIQKNRETLAKRFACDYNIILVLKGHHTVVASPNKLYVNKTGNPGMATAGSGDVLTGIISALLGQGLDGWTAAKTGAYLHGLAGDLAAKEKTQAALIASDIIDHIPEGIKKLRKQL
ncbi:MAG TPA: carbohydrate kinase-like protein, partial [Candidatus Omnitrophica bacterium]|nr:carbohydrate kinase-like protein [Candidatus Omnitrophota bacterium]